MSASQYGEHEFILQHFAGRVGSFLDIGALDGVTFSNTRQVAELGWSGVCVEPSPQAFCALMRNYSGNTRVRLVNAAVVPGAGGLFPFWVNTDGTSYDALSTLTTRNRDLFTAAGHPFREVASCAVSLSELLRFVGPHADFLNIDVEGLNLELLCRLCGIIALGGFTCEMICVEIDPSDRRGAFEDALRFAGFGKFNIVGGNLIAVRE